MWTLQRVLVFVLLLTLVGCARESPAQTRGSLRKQGETLYLSGELSKGAADAFQQAVDSSTKRVVVNSGGGDSLEAIRIGREVRERKLTVVVAGACMSACAHFILPAAAQISIEPNSLVIFHNTSSSVLKMLKGQIEKTALEFLEPRVSEERKFYAELGIPEEFLLQPQIEIRTHCYKYFPNADGTGQEVKFKADFQGWIPTLELLRAVRIEPQGFWPSDAESFRGAFLAVFTQPAKPRIVLSGPHGSLKDKSSIEKAFQTIGECP